MPPSVRSLLSFGWNRLCTAVAFTAANGCSRAVVAMVGLGVMIWYAHDRPADHVLWPLSTILAGLIGLYGAVVLLVRYVAVRSLSRALQAGPSPTERRVRIGGGAVSGIKWSPPWLLSWLEWSYGWERSSDGGIPAVTWEFNQERIRFSNRGIYTCPGRWLELCDPFGVFQVRVLIRRTEGNETWSVIPAQRTCPERLLRVVGAVSGDKSSPAGVAEGDRTDVRQFQEGDSARFIAWKVVARTDGQRLYVRTADRVVSRAFGLFFVPGGDDEPSAELAALLMEKNLLGPAWTFGVAEFRGDVRKPTVFARAKLVPALDSLARTNGWKPTADSTEVQLLAFERVLHNQRIGSSYVILPAQAWQGASEVLRRSSCMRRIYLCAVRRDGRESPKVIKENWQHILPNCAKLSVVELG